MPGVPTASEPTVSEPTVSRPAAPKATVSDAVLTARARLFQADGTIQADPGVPELNAVLDQPAPFWLDLTDISDDVAGWLEQALGVHPLVVEDARQFGELPKLEEFDGYIAVVLYGPGVNAQLDQLTRPGDASATAAVNVSSLDALGEVHCIITAHCIITVHRDNCPPLVDTAGLGRLQKALAAGPASVFYRVADALVDSYFPVLDELDDRLDALQTEVIRSPRNRQLTELASYRSMLTPLHKVLVPETGVFAALSSGRVRIPGADDDQLPYLRDIHDHLNKLSDLTDSYRDQIAGAAGSYSSVVSNQLNVVMKQLAIISAIFLPLTFLTGFFGQNFGALVGHIGSWSAFLIFGIGSEILAVSLLYLLFRRRGWLRN